MSSCRDRHRPVRGTFSDEIAIHIAGATAHRIAGDDVLANGGPREIGGGEDLYLARFKIRLRYESPHAAIVIDMAMRIDHRDDRLVAQLRNHEPFPDRLADLLGDQRVDHDVARFRPDDAHHRQIVPAHLPDAVGDLEQSVNHVELGHPPQARIHRVGRVVALGHFDEVVGGGILYRHALAVADDNRLRQRSEQAATRVLKIACIIERQALSVQPIHITRRTGCRLR